MRAAIKRAKESARLTLDDAKKLLSDAPRNHRELASRNYDAHFSAKF